MGAKISFTHDEDRAICDMRLAGASWPAVARAMGCGRNTVISHGAKLGLVISVAARLNDASPLHRHKTTIRRMCREMATTAGIADELNDLYPAATVTEDDVLLAITEWGLNRQPLAAGHPLTWGAITTGTVCEGSPYTIH